ncbi:hypothetical protein HRbin36_01807 [bacterium HR36]|nr:hypothetical protein HRbin36_01807 [bacterium HR36]
MSEVTPEAARRRLEAYLNSRRQVSEELALYVRQLFPRLKEEAEDIVQAVLAQVCAALQEKTSDHRWPAMQRRLQIYLNQGMDWDTAWRCYLRRLARWRAMDLLRCQEGRALVILSTYPNTDATSPPVEFPGDVPAPDEIVIEAERRERQVRWLSDIFRSFVEWCEHHANRSGLLTKEVYERRVRGQKADDIVQALHLSSRNHVDQIVKRARSWILEQIRKFDVHESVFITLFGREAFAQYKRNSANIPRAESAAPTSNKLGPKKNRIPAPIFRRFEDVLDFVVNEIGALCPSEERLRQYAANRTGRNFSDIRYHVEEAKCRLCLVELESMPSA